MSSSDAEATFRWLEEVDRCVTAASVATRFEDMLETLPSIDPLTVWQSLRRLLGDDNPRLARLRLGDRPGATRSPLPIAHPLDFDWRFTSASNVALLDALSRCTTRSATIGYFGAPTTWRIGRTALPDRRHVLFDKNGSSLDRSSDVHSVTIGRDDLPAVKLAAAVVDPPWYPEHQHAFLAAAASLLVSGGTVFASFPPALTRPGVLAERTNILANAVRAALLVRNEAPLALRYETPPFEAAAFAAAGLPVVPSAWRRGDLLTLEKVSWHKPAVPTVPDEGWRFVRINEIPLAVRPSVAASDCPFEPAFVDATLPTVSRRHPARAVAALWSSRNRIYASAEPELLTSVVEALAGRPTTEACALRRKQENAKVIANGVQELVRLERKEHGLD
jgi:hypothetical protein